MPSFVPQNEMQRIERDIAEKKAHRKHYEDRRKIIVDNIRTAEKELNKMIRTVEVSWFNFSGTNHTVVLPSSEVTSELHQQDLCCSFQECGEAMKFLQ